MLNRLALLTLLMSSTTLADSKDPKPQLDALRTAAKCSDKTSPWRPWCIAADFEKGTAGELPKGKVLVGLTLSLEAGKDVAKALSDKVSLSTLAVGADGKIMLTIVAAENADEAKAVAEAVAATTLVFKDKAKSAKLPKELTGFFKTLKGEYASTKAGSEWTWTNGANHAHLRKVGAYWAVIETSKDGSNMGVTILTTAWE